MKKILLALALMCSSITPAIARDHYRHDRFYSEQYRHHDRTGDIVLGVLGGIVIGSIIANDNNDDEYYEQRDRRYNRYCVDEQVTERVGNRVYRYWVTRCN